MLSFGHGCVDVTLSYGRRLRPFQCGLCLIALPVAKTIKTRAVGDGRVRICETCSLEIAALIAEQRAIGFRPIDGPGQDEEFGGGGRRRGLANLLKEGTVGVSPYDRELSAQVANARCSR